ncbi:MAG: leucine-rich repeat protein, partial [Oscillospiraceae bacterium]|nr:leucine-rich repeat protein [Oscillospiraceae bacterium]
MKTKRTNSKFKRKTNKLISIFLSTVMFLSVFTMAPLTTASADSGTPCGFGGIIASPNGNYPNFINGNTAGSSGRGNLTIDVKDLILGTCVKANQICGIEAVIWGPNTENRQAYIDVNGIASPRFHGSSSPNADYLWAVMSHGSTPNNGGRTETQTLRYMNQYGGTPKVASNVTSLTPFVSTANPPDFTVVIRPTDTHASLVTTVNLLDANGDILGTSTYSTQDASGVWSTFVPDCDCCQYCGFDPCRCFIEDKCKFGGVINSPIGGSDSFMNGNASDSSSRTSLNFDVLDLIDGTAIQANDIYGIEVVTWGDNTENRQVTIEVNGNASPRFHGSTSPHADRIWAIMSHGNTPNNGGRTQQNTLRYMNIYGSTTDIWNNLVPLTPFVSSANPSSFNVRVRPNDNHPSLVTAVTLLDENGDVLGAASYSTSDGSGTWSMLESFVEGCICGECDDGDDETGTNDGSKEYDYTIDYETVSSWVEDGQNKHNILVTINNTGKEKIENWMLAYNFNGKINGIWNASIEKTDFLKLDYIRNNGYNAVIQPGQSTSFGYTLTGSKGEPNSIVMCQEQIDKFDGFSAVLNVNQDWYDNGQNGFLGEVVLINETDKPIEWWELSFDSNFTVTEISNSWAATLTPHGGGKYTFKAMDYTGIIPPNTSAVLGIQAIKHGAPEIWDAKMKEVVINETAVYQAVVARSSDILVHDNWLLYSVSGDTVGIHGFANVNYNNEVVIPAQIGGINVTEIVSSAFTGTTITSVEFPESITEIGDYAFKECTALTDIIIPGRVEKIGIGAFYATGLTSATIGGGVESIGMYAFAECYELETLTFKANNPPSLYTGVFAECNPVVYVPVGTKEAFRAEPQLSGFRYVEYGLNGEAVPCDVCDEDVCLCGYVVEKSFFDRDTSYSVYADAEYDSTQKEITISWSSFAHSAESDYNDSFEVKNGTFEILYSNDKKNWSTLETVQNEFVYIADENDFNENFNEDFYIKHFKIVQKIGDDIVAESSTCYVIWSPPGINWTEFFRHWEIKSDDPLLSKINNDEISPFNVSLSFDGTGIPNTHFRARNSVYSYAMQNDMILGEIPEFVYPDYLSAKDIEIKFEFKDNRFENILGIYPEFDGINRFNIFMWIEELNMSLPIETSIDIENNIVYTKLNRLGSFCLADMEMWFSFLDENAEEFNELHAPTPLDENTFNAIVATGWKIIELDDFPLPNDIRPEDTDSDKDGLSDWDEIAVESGLIEWDKENGITSLPTVQQCLDFAEQEYGYPTYSVDGLSLVSDLEDKLDVIILPILSDPTDMYSGDDNILDIDKLRILPVHVGECKREKFERFLDCDELECDEECNVHGCNFYGCKKGLIERYNDKYGYYTNAKRAANSEEPHIANGFDADGDYNDYLDFYIDYEHYIERLAAKDVNGDGRYLSSDAVTMDAFKEFSVASIYWELTDEGVNKETYSVYYRIDENNKNKITVEVGVEFKFETEAAQDNSETFKELIIEGIKYWEGTEIGSNIYEGNLTGSIFDFYPG